MDATLVCVKWTNQKGDNLKPTKAKGVDKYQIISYIVGMKEITTNRKNR